MASALNIFAAVLLTVVPLLRPCHCGEFTLFCHCAMPAADVSGQGGAATGCTQETACCGHSGCTDTPDKQEDPQPCPTDPGCSQAVAFSAESAKEISTQESPAFPLAGPVLDMRGLAQTFTYAQPEAVANAPPLVCGYLRLCRILI
ncbi:MAG: hypothetical protein IT464_07265 [Planctomycetes bacterium]|nr:hypothetical protein [Planctomycetota bacterium]